MTHDNYLAPGGKEYTLTAGQLAGLKPKSKILDIACGTAVASINLVKQFGCQATAVDLDTELISQGKNQAAEAGIEKRINFIAADFNTLTFPKNSYDMIVAEGGALSYIGRSKGLARAHTLLKKNGYIEISDLILRAHQPIPKKVKDVVLPGNMDVETEDSYRALLKVNHFELVFCSHIAQKYWQNYYDNITVNLKNRKGPLADEAFSKEMQKEMELFKKKKLDFFSYIFIVAKKI
jgi:ubiquinone/menaquinone biosynthesis C-methylase UbiE